MRKVKSKSENLQRPATVRKCHVYERLESPGYENWVRTKYSGSSLRKRAQLQNVFPEQRSAFDKKDFLTNCLTVAFDELFADKKFSRHWTKTINFKPRFDISFLKYQTRKYLRKEMSKRGLKFIVFVQCLLFLSPTNLFKTKNFLLYSIIFTFHGFLQGRKARPTSRFPNVCFTLIVSSIIQCSCFSCIGHRYTGQFTTASVLL